MATKDTHPKLWLAYLLALLLGQTGMYYLYLGRTGAAAVMSGAIIVALAIMTAAPSLATVQIVVAVFVVLTAILIFDLIRMRNLVNSARDKKLQEGSI